MQLWAVVKLRTSCEYWAEYAFKSDHMESCMYEARREDDILAQIYLTNSCQEAIFFREMAKVILFLAANEHCALNCG